MAANARNEGVGTNTRLDYQDQIGICPKMFHAVLTLRSLEAWEIFSLVADWEAGLILRCISGGLCIRWPFG